MEKTRSRFFLQQRRRIVVSLEKLRAKRYGKIRIAFWYRLDLFRYKVFFYNPMGIA
jgi:hypothetical protein